VRRFNPSHRSGYGEPTTTLLSAAAGAAAASTAVTTSAGAAAGGAAASTTSGHLDPNGFLGLNWRAIGASVVVGTLVAVGTDFALTIIKPRLFGIRKQGNA
jgi:hypothetical protein